MEKYKFPNVKIMLIKEGEIEFSASDISDPESAAIIFDNLKTEAVEVLEILCLNTKNVPISKSVIGRGGLNSGGVKPCEIFRTALLSNAAKIIIAHNHPSGNTTPSTNDIAVTKELVKAGKIIGVPVIDHIIIGGITGEFVSLKRLGHI